MSQESIRCKAKRSSEFPKVDDEGQLDARKNPASHWAWSRSKPQDTPRGLEDYPASFVAYSDLTKKQSLVAVRSFRRVSRALIYVQIETIYSLTRVNYVAKWPAPSGSEP